MNAGWRRWAIAPVGALVVLATVACADIRPMARARGLAGTAGTAAKAGPEPTAGACYDAPIAPRSMVPARCDQPHDAEFAGVIARAPIPTGDDEARRQAMLDACEPVVAKFVGALNPRIGWGFDPYGGPIWDAGQMAARCFMVPEEGKKFTASVKGIRARRPATV